MVIYRKNIDDETSIMKNQPAERRSPYTPGHMFFAVSGDRNIPRSRRQARYCGLSRAVILSTGKRGDLSQLTWTWNRGIALSLWEIRWENGSNGGVPRHAICQIQGRTPADDTFTDAKPEHTGL